MGWIFRRGISCCRWAREDCHLVLMGLNVLVLSHWARSVRVQNAIVCVDEGGCGVWKNARSYLLSYVY
jgi:hypothetical protein